MKNTQQLRILAKRLVAYESAKNISSATNPQEVFPAVDKFRPTLATLMGNLGFRSLLTRALVLAGAEVAWLRAVQVKGDGSLQGMEEPAAEVTPEELAEGRVVLVAQLLGLMEAFIGEKLTLRLVGEIWPELSLNDS